MTTPKKIAAIAACVIGLGGLAASAALHPVSAQVTRPGVRQRPAVRHPRIQAALRHLQEAQSELQNATDNYGGHRDAALNLTQQAIAQCETVLAADKN